MTTRSIAAPRRLFPSSLPLTPLLLVLGAALGAGMAFNPGLTAMALTGLCVAVIIAARPDSATPLTIGIIYSNALIVGAQYHGVPYLVPALLPAVLLLPIAYRLLIRRQPIIITPAVPLLALYLVVQLLAALASGDAADSMDELGLFVTQGFLLYVAVINALHSTELVRTAIWTVLIVGTLMAGLTVIQQITTTFDNEYFGFAQTGTRRLAFEAAQTAGSPDFLQARAAGPIGEKNRYAQVLIVLIPLGLFRLWGERSLVLRVAALASTTVIAFGVMLTFSRGAAVGFAALLLALTVLRYVSVRQLALIGFAVLLLAVAMPSYIERLVSLEGLAGATASAGEVEVDPTIQQRANDVLAATLVFVENPVLGIGPGRFPSVYQEYAPRVGGIPGEVDYAAHSLFPGIASETGIIGLTVFGSILLVTMRDLARARMMLARKRPDLVNLTTSFLLAIIVYLGTSVALHMSFQRYFWMLMAMAGAMGYLALKEARALQADQGTAHDVGTTQAGIRGPSDPSARQLERRSFVARPGSASAVTGSTGPNDP
jgi:putative inorganic carbon (hco3(-)) transporter